MEPAAKRFPVLQFAKSIEECVKDAEIVLHLTEWKIYREIDPGALKSQVSNAIMIDGRNALDRDKWIAAGWKFRALGRA
jgi:UDPglucose 6-dehydrogenase